MGAAQEGGSGSIPPTLQVKDRQGKWQTVIEDMGMPAGKPKTIVGGPHGQVAVRFARSANRHESLRVLG